MKEQFLQDLKCVFFLFNSMAGNCPILKQNFARDLHLLGFIFLFCLTSTVHSKHEEYVASHSEGHDVISSRMQENLKLSSHYQRLLTFVRNILLFAEERDRFWRILRPETLVYRASEGPMTSPSRLNPYFTRDLHKTTFYSNLKELRSILHSASEGYRLSRTTGPQKRGPIMFSCSEACEKCGELTIETSYERICKFQCKFYGGRGDKNEHCRIILSQFSTLQN